MAYAVDDIIVYEVDGRQRIVTSADLRPSKKEKRKRYLFTSIHTFSSTYYTNTNDIQSQMSGSYNAFRNFALLFLLTGAYGAGGFIFALLSICGLSYRESSKVKK